jgi:nucleolar protein 12
MAGFRQRFSPLKRHLSDSEDSVGLLDRMPANHIAKGSRQTRRKANQCSAGDKDLGKFDPRSDHNSKILPEQRAAQRSASAESSALGSTVVKTDEDDSVESVEGTRLPAHESLDGATSLSVDGDKSERTLFLGNVAIEAITSRSARRALLQHISAGIGAEGSSASKVETLRFRSIPFSTASMPKRAAYITQSLMSSTTKSCNAYAVLSDTAAVRRAVTSLNGTMVLGRHLRVDHAAKPAPVNHRRCVFVGNLSFVDEERPASKAAESEESEKDRRPRLGSATRDVEEGLWTVFATEAGRVQNIRIIRDQRTRVGKGVAFVHFYVSAFSNPLSAVIFPTARFH